MTRDVDVVAATIATVVGVAGAAITKLAFAWWNPDPSRLHMPAPELPWIGAIVGHFPELFGAREQGNAMVRHFAEARARGKQGCLVTIMGNQWIVPINPRDIEHVMLRRDCRYIKPTLYERVSVLVGEKGLAAIRDESVHTVHRRAMNAAFSEAALRDTFDQTVTQCVAQFGKQLAEQLRAGGSSPDAAVSPSRLLDLAPAFDELTLSVVAEAAFRETNVGGFNVAEQFTTMVEAFSRAQYILVPGGTLLPTVDIQKCKKARDRVRTIAAAMFTRARNSLVLCDSAPDTAGVDSAPRRPNRKLIVDFMAEAGLDASSVEDHCLTMLLAGHETTSVTLQWTTYLLATHQDWQQQLFEEVNAAVHETGVPSLETVRGLTLLRNVIRESMRLFPASSFLNRLSIEDDVLPHSGIFVPKGTEIAMYIFALHRDPAVWGADAHEFNPNRWLDTDRIDNVVGPGGYLPFSLGKRNCIGKEFALNELLATLAVFVRRFHVAWPDGQRHPVRRTRLALAPTEPIKLIVSCR